MKTAQYQFSYDIYNSIDDLPKRESNLLADARSLTKIAYAPYSNFKVAAVALLTEGTIVKGTNQENASFPVGICAERSLLATIGTAFPNVPIDVMAITYSSNKGDNFTPVSPCGMCRQALAEYESRVQHSIRLILSGMNGSVYIINSCKDLLPLAFGGDDLK